MPYSRELSVNYRRYCLGISYIGKVYSGWVSGTNSIMKMPSIALPSHKVELNLSNLSHLSINQRNKSENIRLSQENKEEPISSNSVYDSSISENDSYDDRVNSSTSTPLPSVIDTIEYAINKFTVGKYMNLKGSSRTDAGVNAIRNTCQVDIAIRNKSFTGKTESIEQIKDGINFYIKGSYGKHSLEVTDVTEMDHLFDARGSATARTYMYRLVVPILSPPSSSSSYKSTPRRKVLRLDGYGSLFYNEQAWLLEKTLNIERMRQAIEYLTGEIDFSSFRGKNCQSKSPVRNVQQIQIYRSSESFPILNHIDNNHRNIHLSTMMLHSMLLHKTHELVTIFITADSFLQRMVRNIVGTLIEIGDDKGLITLESLQRVIDARNRRANPCFTAPAKGLFLVDVYYDNEYKTKLKIP